MGDLRDRLAKLERLIADKLVCQECSAVATIVIGPGEDATRKLPAPCEKCGRGRSVIVVTSPLFGSPGSARVARGEIDLVGSLEIDEPDPGKVIAPPGNGVH